MGSLPFCARDDKSGILVRICGASAAFLALHALMRATRGYAAHPAGLYQPAWKGLGGGGWISWAGWQRQGLRVFFLLLFALGLGCINRGILRSIPIPLCFFTSFHLCR